jgi:hypothetical protein
MRCQTFSELFQLTFVDQVKAGAPRTNGQVQHDDKEDINIVAEPKKANKVPGILYLDNTPAADKKSNTKVSSHFTIY